jgi:cation-transporting ATPase E
MAFSPEVLVVGPGVGLTSGEVRERVARGQSNTAARPTSRRSSDIVRANVCTRFNAILGGLFAVILVVGPIQDALFGFLILINTMIGIVQELRAKWTLDNLAIIGEARPRVWRDGRVTEIAVHEVVLDDVIELGIGDQLVVDGIVITSADLEVDESLLTGEADAVVKRAADPVLSGSLVVAGAGMYRATRVGGLAHAAQLAEQASRFSLARSELRNSINQILRWVTWLFIPVSVLTVYGQLRGNQSLADAARGVVAALVSMLPEGLVLLTSIAFAVGVVRLGRRRCLVQELPAIEGLARVDVVCADKTGTLTEVGMRVERLEPVATDRGHLPDPATVLAALAAADPRPNASMRAIADAYPRAPGWTLAATAAFSSARKWSGVSFVGHGNWVLGAPDVLLPLDSPQLAHSDRLASDGLRVLLLGRTDQTVDPAAGPGAVMAVAFVVLAQRIRPEAAATLRYFSDQDVAITILSGDNASAVGAVAAGLHLPGAQHPVDARQLPADPAALASVVAETRVFGRATPVQKQQIIKALQGGGHSVAMAGDGVNDVLALKEAHVGVAMGAGSPAARAVAQIVLLDNAFATLPYVVAEGRRVIGNIERVAHLFLIKTVYSMLLAVLIGAAALPFPFLPRQLSLIGTLTIGVPSFFLALAPNTQRACSGLTGRVLRLAIPVGTLAAAATFACYYAVRTEHSATADQARTAATITVFLIALWALVIIARPLSRWKIGLIAAVAASFTMLLYSPLGRQFFALDPTDSPSLLTALAVAAGGMATVEIVARLNHRLTHFWPKWRGRG